MMHLVQAGVRRVGLVDARAQIVIQDASDEGDGPLGRIDAHDSDGGSLTNLKLLACLRES